MAKGGSGARPPAQAVGGSAQCRSACAQATHPEDSWGCLRCGGKQWRKPKFLRGDASRGCVAKRHDVTG